MDPVREAFTRARRDIESLQSQISLLQIELREIKALIKSPTNQPTPPPAISTNTTHIPTHNLTELYNLPLQALKAPNNSFSTGNEGVPTNQPTNQQTNQRTGNEGVSINTNFNPTDNSPPAHPKNDINHLAKVAEILKSLDGLKKDIRIKFKRLTDQEMAVFVKIYELDDNGLEVTYELLAQTLALSEISIRDYLRKIIAKGIPVEKQKENNKRIILRISDDLKQVASLQTIQQLRNL